MSPIRYLFVIFDSKMFPIN